MTDVKQLHREQRGVVFVFLCALFFDVEGFFCLWKVMP